MRQLLGLVTAGIIAAFYFGCGTDDAQSSASCIEGVTAACVCTNGRSGAQTCGATGAFGACECTGGGDIDAGDVSSPDLCTPGAQAACACPGGQTGVQFCDNNGRFAACACEAAPGTDAGDTSGPTPADGGPSPDGGDATNDPDGQDGQDGQGGQNACGGTSELVFEGAPAAAGDACGCSGTLTCASANELECTGGADPNTCGGCSQLDDEPGAACGSCAAGRWACDGIDALVCDGGRDENLCGGCTVLDGRPGDVCDGDDGAGIWACDGTERVLCNGEGRNACGGNGVLDAPPGSLCGSCGLGTWQCDGREDVTCQNADRGENECGGCEILAGAPGSTCECTGTWQCDAPGSDTVTCVGGSANVCGGCDVLTNRPGDRCATGVFYCADQTLLCGSVDPNDCGGVEPLPADPGQPCGACGSGVWSCASNNAVYCEGDIGEDRFNACGGCTRLPAEPDTACGQCNSGTWTCQGTDGLTCAGESPEALFYHWPDFDQDGFGDRDATPVVLCSPVARFVDNPSDCDDTRNYSFPDAEERCDGRDNNCDGFGDELLTRECYSAPIETRDVGICEGGTQRCISGVWSTCAGETTPSEDTCDTLDNDCDGTPDNSSSLLTDVNNCGECGNRCEAFNTTYACVEGGCEIEACDAGWYNSTGVVGDGCDCRAERQSLLDGPTGDVEFMSSFDYQANVACTNVGTTLVPNYECYWVSIADGSWEPVRLPEIAINGFSEPLTTYQSGYVCGTALVRRSSGVEETSQWLFRRDSPTVEITRSAGCPFGVLPDGRRLYYGSSNSSGGLTSFILVGSREWSLPVGSSVLRWTSSFVVTDGAGYHYIINIDNEGDTLKVLPFEPDLTALATFSLSDRDGRHNGIWRMSDGRIVVLGSNDSSTSLYTLREGVLVGRLRNASQSLVGAVPNMDRHEFHIATRTIRTSVASTLYRVPMDGPWPLEGTPLSVWFDARAAVGTSRTISAEGEIRNIADPGFVAEGYILRPSLTSGIPYYVDLAEDHPTVYFPFLGNWNSTTGGRSVTWMSGDQVLSPVQLTSGEFWMATRAPSAEHETTVRGTVFPTSTPDSEVSAITIPRNCDQLHQTDTIVPGEEPTIFFLCVSREEGVLYAFGYQAVLPTGEVTAVSHVPWDEDQRIQAIRRTQSRTIVYSVDGDSGGEALSSFTWEDGDAMADSVLLDRATTISSLVVRSDQTGTVWVVWRALSGGIPTVRFWLEQPGVTTIRAQPLALPSTTTHAIAFAGVAANSDLLLLLDATVSGSRGLWITRVRPTGNIASPLSLVTTESPNSVLAAPIADGVGDSIVYAISTQASGIPLTSLNGVGRKP